MTGTCKFLRIKNPSFTQIQRQTDISFARKRESDNKANKMQSTFVCNILQKPKLKDNLFVFTQANYIFMDYALALALLKLSS